MINILNLILAWQDYVIPGLFVSQMVSCGEASEASDQKSFVEQKIFRDYSLRS